MIAYEFLGVSRAWLWWLVLAASLNALGCGSGLPATRTVKGKVIYKGGDVRALEGGMVEFQLISEPSIIASGEIKADGTFTLSTWSKDGRSEAQGAAAGEHRVRVDPPNPDEVESQRLIDPKYRDFEKSGIRVTVPTDKIEITIEKRR